MATVPRWKVAEMVKAGLDGERLLCVLRPGATGTNDRFQRRHHWMAIVEEGPAARLLVYPGHPLIGGQSLEVSYVPLNLAQAFIAGGHRNEPPVYRFLDYARSADIIEDPGEVAEAIVTGASRHVGTRAVLGDHVHFLSAFVEDMWGDYARGDAVAASVVARGVAFGALNIISEDLHGRGLHHDGIPAALEAFTAEDRRTFTDLFVSAENVSVADVRALAERVRARPNTPYSEDPTLPPKERGLLADVEKIAKDLVARYGDDVLAVGATGSIGRGRATAGADYDVHVLVRPRSPTDRDRVDVRLYAQYPGLSRRVELVFIPTSFLDAALQHGVDHPAAYHQLDNARHTTYVYDPTGEGARYHEAVWGVRPSDDTMLRRLELVETALAQTSELPVVARSAKLEDLADECARLLLMRYGLGFVKPRYRSVNLEKIRDQEPEFFAIYDPVKGIAGLTPEHALARVRAATRLFENALERAGADYRYRCEEMDLVEA